MHVAGPWGSVVDPATVLPYFPKKGFGNSELSAEFLNARITINVWLTLAIWAELAV